MRLIDLTRTLTPDMPVFPGDKAVSLTPFATMEKDGFNNYRLETGMHVGTHMDGPLHMVAGGKMLVEFPVEHFTGRGVLIDAQGMDPVGPPVLKGLDIQPGDIALVHTGWGKHFGREAYYRDYPVLTEAFAQALVDKGVKIVGLDSPSPDKAPYPIHPIFLGNDVLIVENLTKLEKLQGIPAFQIMALPLKLQADSAPARVVALLPPSDGSKPSDG